MRMKPLIAFCVVFWMGIFFLPFHTHAHRLNVYTWLENGSIMVKGDFGEQKPANNAQVEVIDSETRSVVASGRTGKNGEFRFDVPSTVRQGHGLLIEVSAGEGHKGEWKMEASELYAAASLAAGFEAARLQAEQQDAHESPKLNNPGLPELERLTEKQIRAIIQENLAPINKQLALLSSKTPGIAEIIGGLGWIMGLFGIAFYFKARAKK